MKTAKDYIVTKILVPVVSSISSVFAYTHLSGKPTTVINNNFGTVSSQQEVLEQKEVSLRHSKLIPNNNYQDVQLQTVQKAVYTTTQYEHSDTQTLVQNQPQKPTVKNTNSFTDKISIYGKTKIDREGHVSIDNAGIEGKLTLSDIGNGIYSITDYIVKMISSKSEK